MKQMCPVPVWADVLVLHLYVCSKQQAPASSAFVLMGCGTCTAPALGW